MRRTLARWRVYSKLSLRVHLLLPEMRNTPQAHEDLG